MKRIVKAVKVAKKIVGYVAIDKPENAADWAEILKNGEKYTVRGTTDISGTDKPKDITDGNANADVSPWSAWYYGATLKGMQSVRVAAAPVDFKLDTGDKTKVDMSALPHDKAVGVINAVRQQAAAFGIAGKNLAVVNAYAGKLLADKVITDKDGTVALVKNGAAKK